MVTSSRALLLWAAISAIALNPTAPANRPSADDVGRTVLIQRDLSGPERESLTALSGELSFTADLDADEAVKFFALRIGGQRPEGGWFFEINGEPLVQNPLRGDGGHWFQISPSALREGMNTFVIHSAGGQPLGIEEIEGFSLENTAEEIHLDRLVAPPGTWVQPAVDPAQEMMDVQHIDLAITLDMSAATIPSAVMTMTAQSLNSSLNQCVLDLENNGGLWSSARWTTVGAPR